MIPRGGGLDASGGSQRKACVSVAISRVGLPNQQSRVSLTLDDVDGKNEPQESARARVLDGAFFEAFATVDEKQKGLIKKAKKESKRQAENLIEQQEADSNSVFYPLFSKDSFTHYQAMLLYEELLFVVSHQVGKRKVGADEISPGDLIVYGQNALSISREEHKKIYKKVKERKPPKTSVIVTVVEAKNLEAKDANGLSDPYCMIGILKDTEGRKLSKDGRRNKKIVLRELRDEEHVKISKIKMNTLNPVWNEQFSLEVNDVESEILRIDLWDKDDSSVILDEDNRITSIKGFSGFNRFLKEVAQSTKCDLKTLDDFLGLVEVYIRDIPTDGLEQEYDLEPRSHKSQVQGSIKLKIRLSAEQENQEPIDDAALSTPMKLQRRLLKQFLRYDYDEFFKSGEFKNGQWNMQMSEYATYLLKQFAIQGSLTPYEEAVVKLEVYSSCIQDVVIPMEPLINLIEFIRTCGKRNDLDDYEIDLFIKSIDDFISYSMALIRRHCLIFPPTGSDQCLRLGQLLLCMLNLYKLPLFKATYPDRRISRELEIELKAGMKEWYNLAIAYNEPLEMSDQGKLASLVGVANSLTVFLNAAKKKYIRLFKPTGVDYYPLVYTELETMLSETVQPTLQDVSDRMKFGLEYQDYGTALFEVYLSLKNFKEKKNVIPEEDRAAGPIDEYHEWFKVAMTKWLDLAKLKAIKRIKKAVELDEVRVVHSMLKHSASAVDVTCCLGQICAFWNKLEWPDIAGSYVFLTQITDIVGSCAMEYADIVLDKLEKVDYYEGNADEFDVKEKLCLTMNNLEHVLHFLDSIPDTLNYETFLAELGREHGIERVKSWRGSLDEVIICAQDDMRQKLDRIIVKTGERMKDEITKYLHEICKAAMTEEDPYKTVDKVLSYIDHNLVTFHESLLIPAFKRCLIHVWEVFLFSMEDVVRDTTRRDPKVFAVLQQVLHIAQEFFSGGGNGIDEELIHMNPFESLDKLLSLYGSRSAQIIEKYYMDKCEEQGRTDELFGAITFKVFYSQENHALHVDVLNVRDLPPLDSNNLADPYVQLELLPKHMFKGQNEKRTSVQHETLFAIFDENFSFEVSTDQCLQSGATLVMTVYDRDRFHENDIAGEVFVDLNSVLGLETQVTGGFYMVPQTELPLIHGSLIGQPFRVLMERKDTLATNFVKLRKDKFKKMEDCISKAMGRKGSMKK